MPKLILAPLVAGLLLIRSAAAQDFPDLDSYVEKNLPYALAHAQPRGIPVSICLGQAIVESAYGQSKLAVEGNNHFGMKRGGSWRASVVMMVDDEVDSTGRLRPSRFRAYRSVDDSFLDYAENLATFPVYRKLFSIPKNDYRRWAFGLQKCGYASSPKYAQLLISVIELGGLDRFDLPQKHRGWHHEPMAAWWLDFPVDEPEKPGQNPESPDPAPDERAAMVACFFNEREGAAAL